ncbi:hypothetical protein L596_020130 [Steinernema carpocapsae]|uniref:Uncharacterized protein n=1 Tax=Steinernema carpocapsae TaxID=34508 RepID=A0A4U5MTF5_STECR|nr:hypothetical protein L596_020130 [Steinernema carpocapsae]
MKPSTGSSKTPSSHFPLLRFQEAVVSLPATFKVVGCFLVTKSPRIHLLSCSGCSRSPCCSPSRFPPSLAPSRSRRRPAVAPTKAPTPWGESAHRFDPDREKPPDALFDAEPRNPKPRGGGRGEPERARERGLAEAEGRAHYGLDPQPRAVQRRGLQSDHHRLLGRRDPRFRRPQEGPQATALGSDMRIGSNEDANAAIRLPGTEADRLDVPHDERGAREEEEAEDGERRSQEEAEEDREVGDHGQVRDQGGEVRNRVED